MGRATQLKNEQKEQAENALRVSFLQNNQKNKQLALKAPAPLEQEIQAYKSLAIRDVANFSKKTKSKDRQKQVLELVRFAFGKYTVGPVLTQAWQNNFNLNVGSHLAAPVDMKLWYICVASGGSLYKEHAKPHLSKKEVHIFLTCPHNLSIAQGLCYSVAKAINHNDGISLRIARSKITEKPFNDFWKTCVRFFAEHTPQNVSSINDLVDFLQSRITANRTYSISGNTLASLTKKMHDWHWELQRVKAMGDHRWLGFDIANQEFTVKNSFGDEVVWKITQIKNTKDLAAEGSKMRHCVYSYKYGCVDGSLSIWSLSKKDQFDTFVSKITIELRRNGVIAQARGLANRDARPEEKKIIRLWSQQNNLSY